LNIGLDTFVFIDDNPIERESVKDGLPQVTVPEFPKDSSKLEDFIIDLYNDYFFTLKTTEEDEKKTTVYQQQQNREKSKNQSVSYHQFLENLGTKIVVWNATTEDFPRIMQLVQKTNQFNLTTKRYTEKEISSLLLSDKYTIFVSAVEDKFGNNGKVSLMIINEKDDEAHIDTFILSCRVMGRFIEDQLVDFVEDRYLKNGYKMFYAYYYPTKKNKPVADLYDRLGYQIYKINDAGNKVYRIPLNKKDKGKRNAYGKIIER
jgi:FkbH-like protein